TPINMMHKTIKQLFNEARDMRLSGDEKSLVRAKIQTYVRNGSVTRQHVYRSNIQHQSNVLNLLFKPMPIFIAILVLLGGGTSFAAQNALPGDALYSVKVNVNEQVEGLLSLSAESK